MTGMRAVAGSALIRRVAALWRYPLTTLAGEAVTGGKPPGDEEDARLPG